MKLADAIINRCKAMASALSGVHLIDDWKRAHKLASVRAGLAGTIFTGVGVGVSYASSALSFLPVLSFRMVCAIALLIFLSVIIGRVLIFRAGEKPDDTDQAGA